VCGIANRVYAWWGRVRQAVRWCLVCFGEDGDGEREEADESLGLFVVSKGVDVYLKMLLKDNLMHADLHPGNILLQVQGSGFRV
jgi:hypothetical protein